MSPDHQQGLASSAGHCHADKVGSADGGPRGVSPPSTRGPRFASHRDASQGAARTSPTLGTEVHSMKLFPGLTFSWKRALGITAAKRKISRTTGIPLTRQGRRAKLGKWMGMR
ncbi:MAG: hypothetical protein EBZ88_06100 [Actinobacteria bacterium]|nr:hypothetical protein [Actinomycetota bacterium]